MSNNVHTHRFVLIKTDAIFVIDKNAYVIQFTFDIEQIRINGTVIRIESLVLAHLQFIQNICGKSIEKCMSDKLDVM